MHMLDWIIGGLVTVSFLYLLYWAITIIFA